jgi:hypothetical protein
VNRNLFRGVTAAILSTVVAGTAAVAGTAFASSGPSEPPSGRPTVSYLQQRDLPLHLPAHVVVHHRRHTRAASRSYRRLPLSGSPREFAHALLLRDGWSETQWGCLDALWTRESNWQTYAQNRSGAYGIPQALPGWKMSAMGSDWRSNPLTQIRWGLWYIGRSYGSPCNAYAHSNNYGYY